MARKIELAVSPQSGEKYFKGQLPNCKLHPRTKAMAWCSNSDTGFKGHLCMGCIEKGVAENYGRLGV